jgi:hypothetical protein
MSKNPKKTGVASEQDGRRSHNSGLTMPRLVFSRVDRVVKHLVKHSQLRSRGEFMVCGTTDILDMCEDRSKRVVPEVVLRYDAFRTAEEEEPKIANPAKAQRCGTHFSRQIEERISAVVKRIGWSRNQFIVEAMKTIVDMCEDPSKRVLPLVVILHDAARAYDVPVKLKRTPLKVVR